MLCDECTKPCKKFTETGACLCTECRAKIDETGLSYDMRRKYIESGAVRCPFCNSENIEGGPVDIDMNFATQQMGCACGKTWRDIYRLIDIEGEALQSTIQPTIKGGSHESKV